MKEEKYGNLSDDIVLLFPLHLNEPFFRLSRKTCFSGGTADSHR